MSRILSPTANPTQTVKQETNVNVNIQERSASIEDETTATSVEYPSVSPYVDDSSLKELTSENNKLQRSVTFLKGIINLINSTILKVGSTIVASDSELRQLISALVGDCDDVTIQTDDDFNAVCCSHGKYGKISAITVTQGEDVKNVKYAYPDAYTTLAAYGISTKFVRLIEA